VIGMIISLTVVEGQTKKLRDIAMEGIVNVSIDRLGDFYLVRSDGSIHKYDTDGNFKAKFQNTGFPVTLLEPWNPLRVFVYSKEHQQILLLDRFLMPMDTIELDPALAIEPVLATPINNNNNNIWLLDRADYSMKKVDPLGTRVLEEISLNVQPGVHPDFTFLREYQNQLFLLDAKSGVQLRSVLGKPIRTFTASNIRTLGFLGQEIYYLENGKIKFFDLYSEEQRELPVDPVALFVLLTDERMTVVKKNGVEVWEFKP